MDPQHSPAPAGLLGVNSMRGEKRQSVLVKESTSSNDIYLYLRNCDWNSWVTDKRNDDMHPLMYESAVVSSMHTWSVYSSSSIMAALCLLPPALMLQ